MTVKLGGGTGGRLGPEEIQEIIDANLASAASAVIGGEAVLAALQPVPTLDEVLAESAAQAPSQAPETTE